MAKKRIQKQSHPRRSEPLSAEAARPVARPSQPGKSGSDIGDLLGRIDSDLAEQRALAGRASSPAEKAERQKLQTSSDNRSSKETPDTPQQKDDLYAASDREEPQRGTRGWLRKHRRKLGIGGIVGVMLGGYMMSFLAKPLELFNMADTVGTHFDGLEEASTSRLTQAYRYLKFRDNPEMRRLSTVSNKWANGLLGGIDPKTGAYVKGRAEIELGIKPVVENGNFKGYEVVDPDLAERKLSIADLEARGIELERLPNGKLSKINPGEDFWGRKTNYLFRSTMESLGMGKILARINARPLKVRFFTTFSPLGEVAHKPNESYKDYLKRVKEYYRERWKSGAKQYATIEGKNAPTDATEAEKSAAQRRTEVAEGTRVQGDTPEERVANAEADIKAKVTKGLIVVSLLCVVKGVNDSADDLTYFNSQVPMMIMGMDALSIADQIKSGQRVNAAELDEIFSRMYDPATKSSWSDAKSVRYEHGKSGTEANDIPVSAKFDGPQSIADGILGAVSGFPGLGAVCSFSNSIFGQATAIIVDVVTGGWTVAAGQFLAGQALAQTPLFSGLARIVAGEQVNVDARGAEYGNYVNYGARLASNDQALLMGGRELDDSEELALDSLTHQKSQSQFAEKNWREKLFSTSDPQSLLGQSILAMARPTKLLSSIGSFNLGTFTSTFKNLFGLAKPVEADQKYDYGFKKIGFSVDELDCEKVAFDVCDPYANAQWVEKRMDGIDNPKVDFNNQYGRPCFGVIVNDDGSVTQLDSKRYVGTSDRIDGKCDNKMDEELVRFRFFLVDLMTQTASACYEGDDISCRNLGIDDAESNESTDSDSIVSGDVQQLAKDILSETTITYETNAEGITPRDVIVALSKDESAYTTCSNATNKTADINPSILRFILEAGQKTNVQVNALTDKCHSDGSNHYSGEAVDLDLQSSGPLDILNPIASKYGGTKNFETTHHHYDFPK